MSTINIFIQIQLHMYNIEKIGIIGKRRSGRKTAAWLLAEILEGIHNGYSKEKIEAYFKRNVEDVIKYPDSAQSTYNYILESFGGYILDTIRGLFGTLREYPLESTTWCKEHTLI